MQAVLCRFTVFQAGSLANGDGGDPLAGLVMDTAGNLYGTTLVGGAFGQGTVFKLSSSGNETVLYSFTRSNGDGALPFADLLMDAAGNLYGTTGYGGAYGYGTAFKLENTPQAQIANLQGLVKNLVSTGKLNVGQGQSLLATLNAALAALNAGKATPAVQHLKAFINHVQALVRGGVL